MAGTQRWWLSRVRTEISAYDLKDMRYIRDPYVMEWLEKQARIKALTLYREAYPERSRKSITKHATKFYTKISCPVKEKTVNVQTDDSGAARVTREETSLTLTEIKNSSELMLSSGATAESWRMFIVDSGASYNLIKRSCLTKAERNTIHKAMCISLQTANGIIYADEQADVVVHMLYETTMPFFVLDDTVNVFSLTYLVDEYGFDYHQRHGEAPYFKRKDQPRIYCTTSQNVPLIATSMQSQELEGKLSTRVEAPAEAVGAPAEFRDVEEEDVADESLQAIFDEAEVPIVEVPPPPLVHKVVATNKPTRN